MRLQDAVPDDVEVIKEAETSRPPSRSSQPDRTSTPGGTPIPRTVVEKIDPTAPSHGEVPGTTAYSMRQADAVPDEILKSPPLGGSFDNQSEDKGIKAETPIPTTVVTKIDEQPSHGEVPGTEAYEIRQGDAKPDLVETKDDGRGKSASPTSALQRAIDFVRFTNIFNAQVLTVQPQAKTLRSKERLSHRCRRRVWAHDL